MNTSEEIIIRINADGISIEECKDGVISYKAITPSSLLSCISKSMLRDGVRSGLLPKNCLSVNTLDNGERDVIILHPEDRATISYFGTQYTDFPLPRLLFGFNISDEGRISKCRLGVVGNESNLKPSTPMLVYPFSNVSDTRLCIGNNSLPRIQSLHTLGSLTYHILSMDNNNDHFRAANNKLGLEMRDLLELLKDKQQGYYYEHILLPSGITLGDFIV
ncbi:MAG: hypothetical protein FWG87_01590 [Defluviitaleaceae bacterium]|nr:hypothetical protein [Defluviitaleaceae bacterium]